MPLSSTLRGQPLDPAAAVATDPLTADEELDDMRLDLDLTSAKLWIDGGERRVVRLLISTSAAAFGAMQDPEANRTRPGIGGGKQDRTAGSRAA